MSTWSEAAVAHVRRSSSGPPLDRSLRITLNFHPDRSGTGRPVLEALTAEGIYRSQFETGTSNGGLTAHPGGDRWRWEQRIFGRAYDDAPPGERPKYGALNRGHCSVGGSPRFGSAHLRLVETALDRATFCFPDSTFEPADFGTAAAFDLIGLADSADHDLLDDYVEAHVHGPLRLAEDVEALVLDPCYRETRLAECAAELAVRHDVAIEWHEGRRLPVADLERRPDYRGPHIVTVGRRISQDGWLDARIIGEAVAQGGEDPQDLKKVWHHVARFGIPAV